MLESLIKNPKRLETLNNIALEQVVKEFAPIYRKYKYTLDAPHKLEKIRIFALFLCNRLNNKPELNKILNDI